MTECGELSIFTTWAIGFVCFLFGMFVTAVLARD